MLFYADTCSKLYQHRVGSVWERLAGSALEFYLGHELGECYLVHRGVTHAFLVENVVYFYTDVGVCPAALVFIYLLQH